MRLNEANMTETEWLQCTDPHRMIIFLLKTATTRKARLFACAWSRYRLGDAFDGSFIASFVQTAERYADRLASDEKREAACETVQQIVEKAVAEQDWERAAVAANARDALSIGTQRIFGLERQKTIRRDPHQCSLLREIFGNPFRPVAVQPAWLDDAVVKMAEAIYDGRAWEQMPMLADALEHAGCGNQDVLDHCRKPGQHMLGCWVVDLVLGRK